MTIYALIWNYNAMLQSFFIYKVSLHNILIVSLTRIRNTMGLLSIVVEFISKMMLFHKRGEARKEKLVKINEFRSHLPGCTFVKIPLSLKMFFAIVASLSVAL